MRNRIIQICCLFILTLSFLLPATAHANTLKTSYHKQPSMLGAMHQNPAADFPTVDPNYIYDQLFYMATNFQRREAGYDNNLPVTINGHDEFAAYWAQEISKDLQGFGPQVRRDEFPVKGWVGRPAIVPAFNVEVSVPGVTHPEQVVFIGCHYDGEASSTQSANDDASGCAIELGVARALGEYWRSHHVYPARTLRFVIFDAEEQGLFGSFHYLNSTINGDVQNIVAMFNEEQNGIAYPLRYLGKTSNPLLPFYIDMSPLTNSDLYPAQSKLSQQQRDNITHFRQLMAQAVPAVFTQFQAMGFTTLTYHGDNNQDVSQPVFAPDQVSNVQQEDDTLGGSDQIPFTLAGAPCATFVGNSSYYDNNPPPWSYPFDQPEDTIQLMNTFASGSSHKAQALVLALALPGMLTTWMLNQPDILGAVAADQNPIAAISDIAQTQVNQSISLDAKASFDPNNSNSTLTYAWNFGDGATSSGITVNHVYTTAGNYALTLTVSSPTGKRAISKLLNVVDKSTQYANPYADYPADGRPPSNPAVVLPTPNDAQASTGQGGTSSNPPASPGTPDLRFLLIVGIGVMAVGILLLGIVVALGRRKV
jgi:PKD repeat protein